MGSSISAINDDLEYYEDFCKFLNIKELNNNWYPHFHEIIKNNGNYSKYDTYRILKEKYDNK